jgi:hypothetical protein
MRKASSVVQGGRSVYPDALSPSSDGNNRNQLALRVEILTDTSLTTTLTTFDNNG